MCIKIPCYAIILCCYLTSDRSLEDVLKKRIMVIDGAMGTMIQSCKLQEEDFRGT